MRLKSALEDFEANTLGAVRGALGRFSYVGRLHDGNGTYKHWGLAKIHGEDAAQRAMRKSHRALLSEVLKKPLAVLLNDVQASCSNVHFTHEELTESQFLASLSDSSPRPVSPAAREHLKSVLAALLALVETRNSANRRDA
jgi:hypothetical protein